MAKNGGPTRRQSPKKLAESRKTMHYQNMRAIDRTSLASFAKTLPEHIKDLKGVDIKKAIVGTSKKMGGYVDVNFNLLGKNEAKAVLSYLDKLGYYTEENGAVNTAVFYKRFYKGK